IDAAVADERDELAIWRPGGPLVVEASLRQRFSLARVNVEDREVRMEILEVLVAVALEVVAIDYDGRSGLSLPLFFFFGLIVRIGVVHDQRETLGVGRPRELGDATL